MIWTLAYGTRAEDAAVQGVPPANLRTPGPPPPADYRRTLSVFAVGVGRLRWQLVRLRRLWARVWFVPEAWPSPPPGLVIARVLTPLEVVHA